MHNYTTPLGIMPFKGIEEPWWRTMLYFAISAEVVGCLAVWVPLFGIQVVQVMWGTKFTPETCGAALGFGEPLRDDRTDSSATKLWIFPAQFAQVIPFVAVIWWWCIVTCFNMLHMDLQIAWVLSLSRPSIQISVRACGNLFVSL